MVALGIPWHRNAALRAGSSLAAAADAVEELEATARLYLLLQGQRLRTLAPEQVADIRRRYPAG